MVERKRGALSRPDMEFIRKNVDRFTVDEMAKTLNRTVEPIQRYINNNMLGKNFAEEGEVGDKTHKVVLDELQKKSFYKNLKKQLTVQELEYFNHHWVEMLIQFSGDILPSEEMELKELIILEIMKNREMMAEKDRLFMKDELERDLKLEQNLGPDGKRERIASIRSELTSISALSSNYIRNFKDLCDRADKMRKALHASRQDRAKDLSNAKIDFVGWLKVLDEYDNKYRVGRELEIVRLAQAKEKERLGGFHTYEDKEVRQPLLNAETVESNKKNERK